MKSPIAIDDDLSRTSSAVILESSDTIVRQDSVHTSYDVLPGELGRSERERGGGNLVYVCVVVPCTCTIVSTFMIEILSF